MHVKLNLLSDKIREKAEEAVGQMQGDSQLKALGVDRVMIVETLRDLSTQMAYYARGRMVVSDVQAMYAAAGLWKIGESESRQKTTWTLDSKHLRGEAIDIAPVKRGHVWWAAAHEVWERMGVIGEMHCLKWGGRWQHADGPHFEI